MRHACFAKALPDTVFPRINDEKARLALMKWIVSGLLKSRTSRAWQGVSRSHSEKRASRGSVLWPALDRVYFASLMRERGIFQQLAFESLLLASHFVHDLSCRRDHGVRSLAHAMICVHYHLSPAR